MMTDEQPPLVKILPLGELVELVSGPDNSPDAELELFDWLRRDPNAWCSLNDGHRRLVKRLLEKVDADT